MKHVKLLVVCAAFGIVSCGRQSNTLPKSLSPGPTIPLNIIIILDTSDRISKEKNPDQAQSDIIIARGIVNLFADLIQEEVDKHTQRNKWFPHSLSFVVPEQPHTTSIPKDIIRKLKIWPPTKSRDVMSFNVPKFTKKKDELLNTIEELYQGISRQEGFTGSDIWDWFRASGERYLKADKQNYIICISDGYLDFDKDIQDKRPKRGNKTSYMPYHQIVKLRNDPEWKQKFDSEGHGLLEIGQDFSQYDVKFLMVEITLRDMLDLDILKEYWQQWLASMKINHSEFVESQADPQVVVEKIEAFIALRR